MLLDIICWSEGLLSIDGCACKKMQFSTTAQIRVKAIHATVVWVTVITQGKTHPSIRHTPSFEVEIWAFLTYLFTRCTPPFDMMKNAFFAFFVWKPVTLMMMIIIIFASFQSKSLGKPGISCKLGNKFLQKIHSCQDKMREWLICFAHNPLQPIRFENMWNVSESNLIPK